MMRDGREPSTRRLEFHGVAVSGDGPARAYSCALSVGPDGGWTMVWNWTSGTDSVAVETGEASGASLDRLVAEWAIMAAPIMATAGQAGLADAGGR